MNNPAARECPFSKYFPSELEKDDIYYMKLAFNQAVEAWKEDEVPIGAVAVLNGEVIASDHNRVIQLKDPTAHAEMLCLTAASSRIGDWRLNEVTLYVTKEPCPMCSGAMIMGRVGRVVYAVGDPKMGCLGGATHLGELPRVNHRPKVVSGVFAEPCHQILALFFEQKRLNGVRCDIPATN
jgi:tRNA(adenine34) deaminase